MATERDVFWMATKELKQILLEVNIGRIAELAPDGIYLRTDEVAELWDITVNSDGSVDLELDLKASVVVPLGLLLKQVGREHEQDELGQGLREEF
jgi:hypothetical protein